MKVRDCMCHSLNTVKPEDSVECCAKIMGEKHIGCIPVCDCNQKVVGIVTDRDILLRTVACSKDASKTPVSDVMTTKVYCCDCNDEVTEAEKIMSQEQIRRIPIVDKGNIIGMLTIGDLAKNKNIFEEELSDTIEGICDCKRKNAD